MRFNPKARIDTGRVRDAGGSAGPAGRLPLPSTAGGGGVGIVVLIVAILVKFLRARRRSGARPG